VTAYEFKQSFTSNTRRKIVANNSLPEPGLPDNENSILLRLDTASTNVPKSQIHTFNAP